MKLVPMAMLAAALTTACSRTEAPPADAGQTLPGASAPAATPETGAPAAATQQTGTADEPSTSSPAARPAAAGPDAASAPAAAAAPPPAPVEPPKPQFREVTIPAGTALSVTVLSNLGSATSVVEDAVRGSLAKPVVISGITALPAGSTIRGTVTDVEKSGRVKGRASIAYRFSQVTAFGETHQIQTARVIHEAGKGTKDDVKKGGIGAGIGAVVGGIAGGGSGAAIGAIAGGAGTVLATKGDEIELPAGTVVEVLTQEALVVEVPIK